MLAIITTLTIVVVVTLYQIDVIMSVGTTETVNRDDYTLMSFDISESSGNSLSTDESKSQSMHLSFETIYIELPETDGYKKIELDEEKRENLEADLLAMIEKHNLKEWNGFDEHLQVMDEVYGFSLKVTYKNGDEIIASGGFIFPDNYSNVFADLKEVFIKYCN